MGVVAQGLVSGYGGGRDTQMAMTTVPQGDDCGHYEYESHSYATGGRAKEAVLVWSWCGRSSRVARDRSARGAGRCYKAVTGVTMRRGRWRTASRRYTAARSRLWCGAARWLGWVGRLSAAAAGDSSSSVLRQRHPSLPVRRHLHAPNTASGEIRTPRTCVARAIILGSRANIAGKHCVGM